MKALLTVVTFLLWAGVSMSQTPTGMRVSSGDRVPYNSGNSTKELIGGEHAPLIFSDTDTLLSADTSTTHWMHIGWNTNAKSWSNKIVQAFNPEVFTFVIGLRDESDDNDATDDSVGVSDIRFETSLDTTGDPIWNADSTNLFVADGNYTHAQYGIWMFEDIVGVDSGAAIVQREQAYPLRVLSGAWIRFIFTARDDMVDTTFVDWSLICEH